MTKSFPRQQFIGSRQTWGRIINHGRLVQSKSAFITRFNRRASKRAPITIHDGLLATSEERQTASTVENTKST
jgi:hypothetical protein